MGFQPLDYRCEKLKIGGYIPTGRGGEGVGGIGHESHLLGSNLEHEVEKFGCGVSLDVEFNLYKRAQGIYVGTAYVSLVGPWMHSDTFGTEGLAIAGHLLDRRTVLSAGIAQGGDFIDIDA